MLAELQHDPRGYDSASLTIHGLPPPPTIQAIDHADQSPIPIISRIPSSGLTLGKVG
jgi:hypothetical protein